MPKAKEKDADAAGVASLDTSVEQKQDKDAKLQIELRNHRIKFEDAIDMNAERVKLERNDILLGRGKRHQNHPGNVRFRQIVNRHKEEYNTMKRPDKWSKVQSVHSEIVKNGARFLKSLDNEDSWVVVPKSVAQQKVCHTLRCKRNVKKIATVTTEVAAGRQGDSDTVGVSSSLLASTSLHPASGSRALTFANLLGYRNMAGIQPVPGIGIFPTSMDYYNAMLQERFLQNTLMMQHRIEGSNPAGNLDLARLMLAQSQYGAVNYNQGHIISGQSPDREGEDQKESSRRDEGSG